MWDPFQMAFLWLLNWGDPNHLPSGMILQVFPDAPWDWIIYQYIWLKFIVQSLKLTAKAAARKPSKKETIVF